MKSRMCAGGSSHGSRGLSTIQAGGPHWIDVSKMSDAAGCVAITCMFSSAQFSIFESFQQYIQL